MGLMLGGVSARDLVLDGQSVSLYVGGSPPVKVWPTREVVQITLGTGLEARDQFRDALSARGLDHTTVEEIPFEIELVGTGAAQSMFWGCSALTSVPAMDTSQVTNMSYMFQGCSVLTSVPAMDTSQVTDMKQMFYECLSLTSVPAMDTSQVTDVSYMLYGCASLTSVPAMDTSQVTNMRSMLYGCASLTDGNVRLIGRHPNVMTLYMITASGLTREPFYTTDGQPWPTSEVHEVSLTEVSGTDVAHALTTLTIPEGQTWQVRVQGQITKASVSATYQPFFRIGAVDGAKRGVGAVDVSGTVTSTAPSVALVTTSAGSLAAVTFIGTVTIEK